MSVSLIAHDYHPSVLHMGDCSICGNVADHPNHVKRTPIPPIGRQFDLLTPGEDTLVAHGQPLPRQEDAKMEIAELIGRLEQATGPDREIDCLIWQLVNPGQRVMFDPGHIGRGPMREPTYGPLSEFPMEDWVDWNGVALSIGAPNLTASLDAITALIERELPGAYGRMQFFGSAPCKAHLIADHEERFEGFNKFTSKAFQGEGPTLQIALCLAFLRALASRPTQQEG